MRPRPVTSAAAVAALLAVAAEVIGLLVAFGVEVSEPQRIAILGTMSAVGVLATVIGAMWAARRVTPLEDPRDVDDQPLVRVDALDAGELRLGRRRLPPDDRYRQ